MDTSFEAKNKQDVMVSNLPLLFSDGKPTSLDSMDAQDLQYFIPFLIKCILGCEPPSWVKYPKFKWWPEDVPWSPIILTTKHQTSNWKTKLQSVVKRCYEHNGCSYLLQFSARLQQLSCFKFNDNWDGTTSMLDANSGKLLVTFRNENMNYDKGFRHQDVSPRPTLLSRLNSPTSPTKLGVGTTKSTSEVQEPPVATMVEPPATDLYLCDYCGTDFNSLRAIKNHEVKCMAEKASEVQSSINNALEEDPEEVDEAKFLWYLRLMGRNETGPPPNVTPAKKVRTLRKPCTLIAKRFTTIPFSSNLGQSFFKTREMASTQAEHLVSRYERLCIPKPVIAGNAASTDQGTHSNAFNSVPSSRVRFTNQKRKEEWAHTYSFNKADREERSVTIATGLNKRARKLLQECRPAHIRLHHLTTDEIEKWTRPKPKLVQPLLQPWLQKSIANLPPSCTISLAPVDSPQSVFRHRGITPKIVATRREKPTNNRPQARKRPTSEPPALLPLITSAWSMQTMQSVKPRPARNQFVLPDLIPVVNCQPKMSSPEPVVINMPSFQKSKAMNDSPSVTITPSSRCPQYVDLCSSDEDSHGERGTIISTGVDKPLVLPPGISVTKIERTHPVSSRARPSNPGAEQNNNRSMFANQLSNPTVPKGQPPSLKFMGQSSARLKMKSSENSPIFISDDISIQTVTPLRIGKMPAEKREKMKQSLLKLQKKEGVTSPASDETTAQTVKENASPPFVAVKGAKDLSKDAATVSESNLAKHNSQGKLSNSNAVRRKRIPETNDVSEESDDQIVGPPQKKVPKLDPDRPTGYNVESQPIGEASQPPIEIDVSSSDTETRASSRSSWFGSPENKNGRKRNELSLLLNDECKELRRKGLESLPIVEVSNQRVTRCRTKSLPQATHKP